MSVVVAHCANRFLYWLAIALVVSSVSGQTVPPSTNPSSAPYFSPNTTKTLYLGETVSSVIYNANYPGGYQDHYQVFVPSWVGAVRFTLSNTSPASTYNFVQAFLNSDSGPYDNSVGFSCYPDYGSAVCSVYDKDFFVSTDETETQELSAGYYFLPGTWLYLSINKYYIDSEPVTYSLTVEAITSCSDSEVVGLDYGSQSCIPTSQITPVAYSGASYSANVPPNTNKFFRVDVPKNTARIYALISSDASNLYVLAAGGYFSTSPYTAWEYTYYGYYNSTTNTYNTFLQVEQPIYDTQFYFTIKNPNVDAVAVTIQFFWDACGPNSAGLGSINVDYYSLAVSFTIPDCSFPVVPSINVASFDTVAFNVPAFTASPDTYMWHSAAYGFMHVPNGTAGYRNFTCTSSADNLFVVFSKGQTVDCNGDYSWYVYCSGPSTTVFQTLQLLSEDLYPGGDWSIGACSSQNVPTTVYLQSSGYIYTAPSPSPTPSSSPSSYPSSAPSQSPTPSPDSGSSSDGPQPASGVYVLLIVVGFLLGVIIGLILGFCIFNKLRARKEASMAYVPLQPYPMVPVQVPMYHARN